MKILITGAYGQLGNEIKEIAPIFKDWQFIFTDVDILDITNEAAVQSFFRETIPDFVINCAAYTAVDKAESDEENAYRINAVAPGLLAKAAKKSNAGFLHISTDYVFDGKNYQPYREDDAVNPQSVYGKTKLDGEKKCMDENQQAIIIRTAWLYSFFGNNFVKTMLRLGKERDMLNVVYDQIGSPTYAGDLAFAILKIAEKFAANIESVESGVYNFSNEGAISWYDFAISIFEISGINCVVKPILSKEFKMDAPRPHYSVFDKSKIKNNFQLEIPYWKESLEKCISRLRIKKE